MEISIKLTLTPNFTAAGLFFLSSKIAVPQIGQNCGHLSVIWNREYTYEKKKVR
jgi:hypothetical protein